MSDFVRSLQASTTCPCWVQQRIWWLVSKGQFIIQPTRTLIWICWDETLSKHWESLWTISHIRRWCRQSNQEIQGWCFCICTTSPWQGAQMGIRSRHEVLGYSLLQRQGLSSWPRMETALGTATSVLCFYGGLRTRRWDGHYFWAFNLSSNGYPGGSATNSEADQITSTQKQTAYTRAWTGQP